LQFLNIVWHNIISKVYEKEEYKKKLGLSCAKLKTNLARVAASYVKLNIKFYYFFLDSPKYRTQ
jgi:hypothetical protein